MQFEISYCGAVDDLPRSVHLLAVAVERELTERLVKPLCLRKPITLGPLLAALREVLDGKPTVHVPPALLKLIARHRVDLEPLRGLYAPIKPLEGAPIRLGDVRNAVAHGTERRKFPRFNRLFVDAIKRKLVLEPAQDGRPLLRVLAELPLLN